MIDEDKTFRDKGYRSTDLKPNSHKLVFALCEGEECQREGGRGRWVRFQSYRRLCHSCAHRTEECRRKQRESGMRGNLSEETLEKMRDIAKKRNFSKETRIKIGESKKGERHHNWKGGITPESKKFYNSGEYAEWRKSVFERDGYICQECGDDTGGNLNAHHILPLRDYRDPEHSLNVDNGITLCEDCHDKTRWKEYEFVGRYQEVVNRNLYIVVRQLLYNHKVM